MNLLSKTFKFSLLLKITNILDLWYPRQEMDDLIIFLDAICEKGECQTMPLDEFTEGLTEEQLELLEDYELSGNFYFQNFITSFFPANFEKKKKIIVVKIGIKKF